jgi:hypothetical protein
MLTLKDHICVAIETRRRVQFEYHNKLRIAEPQAVGISTAGNEVARFRLVQGGSRPEQLFSVSEIKSFTILPERFTKPGPNYSKNDSAMKKIFCQL